MIKLRTPLGVALATLVLSSTFLLTACSGASFVTELNAVVAAADATVTVLASDGAIPPADAAAVEAYLSAVSEASSEAATELASADSSKVKALKIAADFAQAALPVIPANDTILAEALKVVDAAVKVFLAAVQPANSPAAAGVAIHFGPVDRLHLAAIRNHAHSVEQRIQKLRN